MQRLRAGCFTDTYCISPTTILNQSTKRFLATSSRTTTSTVEDIQNMQGVTWRESHSFSNTQVTTTCLQGNVAKYALQWRTESQQPIVSPNISCVPSMQ